LRGKKDVVTAESEESRGLGIPSYDGSV